MTGKMINYKKLCYPYRFRVIRIEIGGSHKATLGLTAPCRDPGRALGLKERLKGTLMEKGVSVCCGMMADTIQSRCTFIMTKNQVSGRQRSYGRWKES